jgi:hypothetical protein
MIAIRKHLHRHRVFAAHAHAAHHEHLFVVVRVQVANEIRMTHEMRDVLAQVALCIESEVLLGDRVAPLDLVVIVEHRHTVR